MKKIGFFTIVVSIVVSIVALNWAMTTRIADLSPDFRANYTEGIRIGLIEAEIEINNVDALSQTIMAELSVWDNIRLTIFQSEKIALEIGVILLEHIQEEHRKDRAEKLLGAI